MRRFPFTAGSGFFGLCCALVSIFLLSFRDEFLIVFIIVLGCQHGAFLEPKIDQHATYEFLIFIDFILVFPLLLRLGGSYVGSISVFFLASFFCIVFWSIWGSILELFGEPLGGPNR